MENSNRRNQAWLLNNENILELGGCPYREIKAAISHIIFILPSQNSKKMQWRDIFREIINEEFKRQSLIPNSSINWSNNK